MDFLTLKALNLRNAVMTYYLIIENLTHWFIYVITPINHIYSIIDFPTHYYKQHCQRLLKATQPSILLASVTYLSEVLWAVF